MQETCQRAASSSRVKRGACSVEGCCFILLMSCIVALCAYLCIHVNSTQHMSHSLSAQKPLSRRELARKTGHTERHISRLAKSGAIPGTEGRGRAHYARLLPVPDSAELQLWIAEERKRRIRPLRRKPSSAKRNELQSRIFKVEALSR